MTVHVPLTFPDLQIRRNELALFEKQEKNNQLFSSLNKLVQGIRRNFLLVNTYLNESKTNHLPLSLIDVGKGATKLTAFVMGNYTTWEMQINDEALFIIDFPHDMDLMQDITIHLSWLVDEAFATASAVVEFDLTYALCPQDGTEAIDAPADTGTVNTGDVDISATAKAPIFTDFVIPAADITDHEDILGLLLKRITPVGTSPANDVRLLGLHIEYTSDKRGSTI